MESKIDGDKVNPGTLTKTVGRYRELFIPPLLRTHMLV